MTEAREFDIIVYGSTGFTGRLIVEYLIKQYASSNIKWAMAGRSLEKLQSVRDEIGAPSDTPLVITDSNDLTSVESMVKRANIIITTVGPYQLYGNELIAACCAHGTDYCDLSGEPAWMRMKIDAHEAQAKESGARIVFSSGFDSIPFDLGVLMLQKECFNRYGQAAPRIKGRVRAMQGTFSGGTAASLKATMAAAAKDPMVIKYLTNPFSLAPGFNGPEQPAGNKPIYEESLKSWAAPFVMAPINTKNVHRTNALLGHEYGEDFIYDEMMLTGDGEKGEQMANFIAKTDLMGGDDAPKPGEGPSKEERENGFYDILFVAEMDDGATTMLSVKGDKDPGYGSTSKMITETAMDLLDNKSSGGIYTTGALLGESLVKRLEENAGLAFTLEG